VEIYVWSAAGLLVLALLASFRMHVLQHRRIAKLGDRVAQLTAGISLLTDTVEGGLRDVAQEIERLGAVKAAPKPKARAATQRRVSTAARRGRSVQDIAAKEQMSESEVRLRLQLAGANGVAKEKAHASVR
jgi:DNA-binding NarL/FixJ family response regulator